MSTIFDEFLGRLIVSCQAYPGDPLEDTDAIRRMALSAIRGGAAGLRLNGATQVKAVRRDTALPIIAIEKQYGPRGLRITPDFASASALAAAGASIIALDCTDRDWGGGEPWPSLVQQIHERLGLPVMADISTIDEALAAEQAGADCVGTTLYGYTEQTQGGRGFSWPLLAEMHRRLRVPIMAEGHLSTPEEARRAIDEGAWCVIIGSAITRPGVIAARFARALADHQSSAPVIGVDIGGTSIKAGVVQRDGGISFSVQVPTEAAGGREAIVAGLVRAVEETLDAARRKNIAPAGIGIATAGVPDRRTGAVFAATGNLPGWSGFELRTFAEERFRLPVVVINDAQAAALAELHFGAGRGFSDFALITLGTGVGGGVVVDGELMQGQYGFAGTIGHTVIHAGGRPCNCGRSGCLEAYVSTASLVREFRAQGEAVSEDSLDDAALAFRINRLAREGNSAAKRAYEVLAQELAEGFANLFNLFDPQIVLLSGGLIEGYAPFISDLEHRVTELLHFGQKRRPRIGMAATGIYAGVQGAATPFFMRAD